MIFFLLLYDYRWFCCLLLGNRCEYHPMPFLPSLHSPFFCRLQSPPLLPLSISLFLRLFLSNVSLFSFLLRWQKYKYISTIASPASSPLVESSLSSLCDVIQYESHVTRIEQEIIDRTGVQRWQESEAQGKGFSPPPEMLFFRVLCHLLSNIIIYNQIFYIFTLFIMIAETLLLKNCDCTELTLCKITVSVLSGISEIWNIRSIATVICKLVSFSTKLSIGFFIMNSNYIKKSQNIKLLTYWTLLQWSLQNLHLSGSGLRPDPLFRRRIADCIARLAWLLSASCRSSLCLCPLSASLCSVYLFKSTRPLCAIVDNAASARRLGDLSLQHYRIHKCAGMTRALAPTGGVWIARSHFTPGKYETVCWRKLAKGS